ncbi:PQQ-binding-like beta-propeller repeat protein [Dactylosporangium sp. AC04546]|uniref:hsp70 family protein n=1 Tax=Dactylosporangium sp. AC04546 TaxID=2862460 RepID=UPI001EDF6B4A|nr:hsp70 family protein [Dactylosporangium sp. AC04546]WVK87016.1 PQQ-binding-like beta-propeller repeat protein [Dactylosporangium sp. AC04546]
MTGWTLSVDFGMHVTTAAAHSGGTTTLLELEAGPALRSAVCVGPDGRLLTGKAAVQQAGVTPSLAEWQPKRALSAARPSVRLGGRDIEARDMVAAVLDRVVTEARKTFGSPPTQLRMTHPIRWGERELAQLAAAASQVGLPEPSFVAEPVAAAAYYGAGLPLDSYVAVFDLGGSGLQTAVLRRTRSGFTVIGPPGGDKTLDGDELDGLLFDIVAKHAIAADAAAWAGLTGNADPRAAADRAELQHGVTDLKHALSEHTAHMILPAGFSAGIRVTRPEFEAQLDPLIRSATDELRATVGRAGLRVADLAAVFLAGGSCRIPLVAALLTDALGRTPVLARDPKSIVTLGALCRTRIRLGEEYPPPPVAVTWLSSYRAGREPDAGPLPTVPSVGTRPAGWRPWRVRVPGAATALAYAGETVFVAGAAVAAADRFDGTVRWTSPPVPPLRQLEVAGGLVYGHDGIRVLALDATTGKPRWAYQAPGRAIVDPAGVAVSMQREVRRLDQAGKDRWRVMSDADITAVSSPGDGRMYLCTADGGVRCVDAETGAQLWRVAVGRGAPGAGGGVTVLAGVVYVCGADSLHALDAESGANIWRVNEHVGSGTVLAHGDLLYLVRKGIAAFAADDGALLWRTAEDKAFAALPSVGEGSVCGRLADAVVAFDAVSGRPRWAVASGAFAAEPVIANGQAHLLWTPSVSFGAIGTGRSAASAVDLTTGATLWRTELSGSPLTGPMIVGDIMFLAVQGDTFGSAGAVLHAINSRTGDVS